MCQGTFDDVVEMMPEKYNLTAAKVRFLHYIGKVDEQDQDGMLLFISPSAANVLAGSTIIFADGTFETCPPPFKQIYVAFGKLRDDKVVPCAFGLLPNKQHNTYKLFWSKIKEMLPATYCPEYLLIDFEASAAKGFLEIFPDAKISGCQFHFHKNLVHQLGQKGCLVEYNNSPEFQQLVQLMQTLAFVPADDVVKVWENVIEPFMYRHQDLITPTMDEFIDYFLATYVGKVGRNRRRGNPKIPFSMWTKFQVVVDQVPCTNNSVEAWNGAWNRSTPPNASVWTILDGFVREEGFMNVKLHEARQLGSPGSQSNNSRRLMTKQKEERLRNIVSQYNSMDSYTYLKEVGAIIKL